MTDVYDPAAYRHRVLRLRSFPDLASANGFLDSHHIRDIHEVRPIQPEKDGSPIRILILYYAYPEDPDPERNRNEEDRVD